MAIAALAISALEIAITGRREPFGKFASGRGVTVILAYWWYHLDKVEHGFRAGAIQNIGVVVLTVIAIPVYFIRSRGWKRGGVAIALALGFVLLVSAVRMLVEYLMTGIAYG